MEAARRGDSRRPSPGARSPRAGEERGKIAAIDKEVTAADDAVDTRILHTREVVLRATLELISEIGVDATTIKRIADRTGIARSTIYRRWPDISQLYLEAFERIVRTPLPKPVGNTAGELRAYLVDYAERLNDPTYFSVLIGLVEWGWRNPVFAEAQHDFFDERRGRAATIIRAGRKAGTIRKDISVADTVKAIEAPFLYTRMIDGALIEPDEIERVLASLLEAFTPRSGHGSAPAS